MRFDQEIYEFALLKGDLLIYSRELVRALETNSQLIKQSFHSVLLGEKDLQHHVSNLEMMSIENAISIKMLVSYKGKSHICVTTNPCAAKLKGIGSLINVSHLRRTPKSNRLSQTTRGLKLKISKQPKSTTRFLILGLKQMHLMQMALPRLSTRSVT